MKRRLLFWALAAAFAWVIISRQGEINTLLDSLRQGRWGWIATAVGLQILYFVLYTFVYQAAFTAVDVPSRFRDLFALTFAAIFINSTAPSGGAAGVAIYVDDANQRDESGARAAVGTLLVLIADFGAFLIILSAGLIILFTRHDLLSYEIVTGIIMFLYVGGMTTLLGLGLWRPAGLRRILEKIQSTVNRLGGWFRQPAILREEWSAENAAEFETSARLMTRRPSLLMFTFGLALVARVIDVTILYALFMAFNVPPSLGVIIAGYAMTILFWIVSPTPNGIGVVEGLMPVVYVSLGLPAAEATLITLAFRGLAFWIPFLIGFLLLRRLRSFTPAERSLAHLEHVRLIAVLTAGMGVLNILSASTPALASRMAVLERYSPLAVTRGGNLTAVLAGFALLLLSVGLWRRKRTAWLLTLVMLLISAVSHLVKGLDYEEAVLALLLAGYLLWQRPRFQARSDPPSLRRAIWLVPLALLFTWAYGTLGFYLLDRQYSVNFSLPAAIRQTLVMFTEFYDPGLTPITGFGRYFAASIYVVGAVTLAFGLLMLLRPVIVRRPAGQSERARAQAIVMEYGRSTLSRFLLFDDKSYWFSPGGSVVGYGVKGRMAVALGDPVGPAADAAAAITGFRDFCQEQGWQCAFYQTLPDYRESYQAAGFEVVRTGHEAVVDLHTFSLEGKAGKQFRNAASHMTRLGYKTAVTPPPLPEPLLHELRSVSDEWLAAMHGQEKQFSLGWFHDEYVRSCPVVTVTDELGRVTAFANIVAEYAKNEATIDLMRRRRETESGTMDFLFAALLTWAKAQGYDSFNLGLSSLAGVGENPDDPAVEKAMHFVYGHVNQFYNFQGLHAFKEKFHPVWEPRYVVFPNYASLPLVWTTLAQLGSGEHFVSGYLRDLPPALKQIARSVSERYSRQQTAVAIPQPSTQREQASENG